MRNVTKIGLISINISTLLRKAYLSVNEIEVMTYHTALKVPLEHKPNYSTGKTAILYKV